jgi:signal transduction histidine kinase
MIEVNMLKSIRWRLPLSYAAIALLAALSLGIVLLTTLRSYYRQHELNYLTENARGISSELARLVQADLPPAALQAQLKSFAFLAQTRVRLLDEANNPVADSGEPQDRPQVAALSIEVEANEFVSGDMFTKPIKGAGIAVAPEKGYASFIYLKQPGLEAALKDTLITRTLIISTNEAGTEVFHWQVGEKVTGSPVMIASETAPFEHAVEASEVLGLPPDFISFVPAVRTPYGFGLNAEVAADGHRSDQVVSQPFYDAEGKLLGYAELSQGPAYGREIVESVAWGWAGAGGVAVLLAAGVGWLISRQLSAPLLALTEVTASMAAGNLSVRAEVKHDAPREVGLLAGSFNEMAEQVEETVLTLRRFVADAAHELHTPLTALRTNLELGSAEANPQPFINRAQTQVERLETLTRDLLDLSRLETGASQTNFGPVNLNPLVQEVGELYASRAEQMGLTFSLELPEQPLAVSGNEAHLRRALSNLLDNALKFTSEGGSVWLGLRPLPAQNWAELWVEDTGLGIPATDVPQLFSRFHRGRNATAYPGSGLGLAIVKAITEGHGGQVAVENRLTGACFQVRLPLV